MIEPTMVQGSVIVKAKRIGQSSDDYYLEFELTNAQKHQLIAELIVTHCTNNTLTYIHKYETNLEDKMKLMEFLKGIIEIHGSVMSDEVKNDYLKRILDLTKEVEQQERKK